MYFKLAMRNVKKSYRDFLIYFLTLTFSVCLFYTFNSFESQQAVMAMTQSQLSIINSLSMIMNLLSIFVSIILAFLILYANNFLIRRRKKELAIYMILGMAKGKISTLLVYETLTIGIISLVSGLFLGILASQILTAVTANLFVVSLDYKFIFSPSATLLTIIAFSIIFIITMIFNTFILNRYKLINLLQADRMNAQLKVKRIWLSVIFFIISIACLGWAYDQTITKGLLALENIGPIIVLGSIGTFLFFLSLAGFLLTIIKTNKRIYFKNLNCFILRQIHSNINVNFVSMSIVCIMLLLSIGALSTGFSLKNTINSTIRNTTPYDYSLTNLIAQSTTTSKAVESPTTNTSHSLQDLVKQLNIDPSYIKSSQFVNTYDSNIKLSSPQITNYIKNKTMKLMFSNVNDNHIRVIPLSAYNAVRTKKGLNTITLKDNEIYAYGTVESASTAVKEIIKAKPTYNLYGKPMQITNTSYDSLSLDTTADTSQDIIAFIINDNLIPVNAKVDFSYWNVDLNTSITSEKFDAYIKKKIDAYNNKIAPTAGYKYEYVANNKMNIYELENGIAVVFTYIGIYLGIIFMIASAVILALQQLSQASDNKKRYLILSKIGTEQKLMNHSILTQIGIYFFIPLALAIVHSYVGIRFVSKLVEMFGQGNILVSSAFTAGIIIVIYGTYFLITYIGYKNILKS